MACKAFIEDSATGRFAKVTENGQLVVAPLHFSETSTVTVDLINTAYSLWPPRSNQQFVITDMLIYANKNVGASDATVTVYEANAVDTTTESRVIVEFEMLKQTSRDFIGLNLLVTAGKWLNIKTNDDDIFATVMGYYIDVQ